MSVLKLDVVVLVGVVDVLVLHLGCSVVGISENHGVVWSVPRTVTLEIPNKGTGFKLKIVALRFGEIFRGR